MAVVSITIKESQLTLPNGLPQTIALSTNISGLPIFYTLDGSTPTTSSNIYISDIDIPGDMGSVTLSILATDGSITSTIITKTYDVIYPRVPWATVTNGPEVEDGNLDLYPFGGTNLIVEPEFGPKGGPVMNSQSVPVSDKYRQNYDGTATDTPSSFTDEPLLDYELVFSESNALGERGHGIGTLPQTVSIRKRDPEYPGTIDDSGNNIGDMNSVFFNPKAAVIYQDARYPDENNDVVHINRQFFSLENPEVVGGAGKLFKTGLENQAPTGAFLRSFYNAKENTITYFYHDRSTLRWIISVEPYAPNQTKGLFHISFSPRSHSARYYYKWYPFRGRRLT